MHCNSRSCSRPARILEGDKRYPLLLVRGEGRVRSRFLLWVLSLSVAISALRPLRPLREEKSYLYYNDEDSCIINKELCCNSRTCLQGARIYYRHSISFPRWLSPINHPLSTSVAALPRRVYPCSSVVESVAALLHCVLCVSTVKSTRPKTLRV